LFVLTLLFIFCSCDDPCDEGYTQQVNADGSTFCVPDFLTGKINNFELGDTYFHSEHGVIRIKKEDWFNTSNQIIFPE